MYVDPGDLLYRLSSPIGGSPPDSYHVPVNEVPESPLSMIIDVIDDNTVTAIVAEPGRSSLSVTEAVMVCVPCESDEVENAAPLPMTPSRF